MGVGVAGHGVLGGVTVGGGVVCRVLCCSFDAFFEVEFVFLDESESGFPVVDVDGPLSVLGVGCCVEAVGQGGEILGVAIVDGGVSGLGGVSDCDVA